MLGLSSGSTAGNWSEVQCPARLFSKKDLWKQGSVARNDRTSNGLVAKAPKRKVDGVLSAELLPGEIFCLFFISASLPPSLLCNF